MGFAPRQNPFLGGLGGLFGGMGGFNPYQQQMPMMGGFNPYMGGGFNPYMGGGFNPYMGGGFNPYMGGGFNPMMRGRFELVTPPEFEGYDFDSPIGEAADLRPEPPGPIERPPVDERDLFDSGSVPGEPGFSIEQDPRDMVMVSPMGDPVPAANGVMGRIDEYNQFLGTTPEQDRLAAIPSVEPALNVGVSDGRFEIPGVDLEKIRQSLAKIEPVMPGIKLPEPVNVAIRPPAPPTLPTKPIPVPRKMPTEPRDMPISMLDAVDDMGVPIYGGRDIPKKLPRPVMQPTIPSIIPKPVVPGPMPEPIPVPSIPKVQRQVGIGSIPTMRGRGRMR